MRFAFHSQEGRSKGKVRSRIIVISVLAVLPSLTFANLPSSTAKLSDPCAPESAPSIAYQIKNLSQILFASGINAHTQCDANSTIRCMPDGKLIATDLTSGKESELKPTVDAGIAKAALANSTDKKVVETIYVPQIKRGGSEANKADHIAYQISKDGVVSKFDSSGKLVARKELQKDLKANAALGAFDGDGKTLKIPAADRVQNSQLKILDQNVAASDGISKIDLEKFFSEPAKQDMAKIKPAQSFAMPLPIDFQEASETAVSGSKAPIAKIAADEKDIPCAILNPKQRALLASRGIICKDKNGHPQLNGQGFGGLTSGFPMGGFSFAGARAVSQNAQPLPSGFLLAPTPGFNSSFFPDFETWAHEFSSNDDVNDSQQASFSSNSRKSDSLTLGDFTLASTSPREDESKSDLVDASLIETNKIDQFIQDIQDRAARLLENILPEGDLKAPNIGSNKLERTENLAIAENLLGLANPKDPTELADQRRSLDASSVHSDKSAGMSDAVETKGGSIASSSKAPQMHFNNSAESSERKIPELPADLEQTLALLPKRRLELTALES